ncbi:eukaryotic translation initiation factor 5 [Neoconidiobolus thromboides FSU 785]|nr:eukaryotic translation initiation factor 5 [Neoconidiobolus thromboides FSU 785]
MTNINIRRDNNDPFYRYKMPKLISKIEGKGNGIKTVIPNMPEIAKALSRPPEYPTKFFGCELGAQVKSEAKNDRYIVNGAHEAEKLQDLLYLFIEKFVLCKECKNPETDLFILKDQSIIRDCKACGKRSGVDMKHRLSVFIIKNPPPPPKKIKKSVKASEDGTFGGGSPEQKESDDEDELTARINREAAQLANVEVDDNDWAVDMSAEAIEKRTKELQEGINSLILDDDDEDEGDNPYEKFGTELEGNVSVSDEEIIKCAEEHGVLGKHRTVQVLVQVIFNEKIVSQLPKRVKLLRKFITGEKHQKALLGGIERLVGITFPNLMAKVPVILKLIYDFDLVEEEIFLKWGEKPSKKYVDKKISKTIKEKAQPFLSWLE